MTADEVIAKLLLSISTRWHYTDIVYESLESGSVASVRITVPNSSGAFQTFKVTVREQ